MATRALLLPLKTNTLSPAIYMRDTSTTAVIFKEMFRLAVILLAALLLCAPARAQTQPTPAVKPKKTMLQKINPLQQINVHSPAFQDVTAQFAHVGAGYGVVTGMRLAGHNTIGISGMGGFVLAKEFWYDRKYEKQNLKENLRDTAFYALGIGAAILQGSIKR